MVCATQAIAPTRRCASTVAAVASRGLCQRAVKLPVVRVPSKAANVFHLCEELVGILRRSPEALVCASGAKASHSILRLCALAGKELDRSTGFLPGFGALALRVVEGVDSTNAVASVASSLDGGVLRARVARLLEPPAAVGATLLVGKADTSRELAEVFVERLSRSLAPSLSADDEADAAEGRREGSILLRFVGEEAAVNVLEAVVAAETMLATFRGRRVAGSDCSSSRPRSRRVRLAIAPAIGASLDAGGLRRQEIFASLFLWTTPAPLLPAPAPPRLMMHFE